MWLDMCHHLNLTPEAVDRLPVGKLRQAISAIKHLRKEIEKQNQ